MDGALKEEIREPPGPVRALQLSSPLVVGASVDYRDGFVGCIRAFLLNGRPMDLKGYAERGKLVLSHHFVYLPYCVDYKMPRISSQGHKFTLNVTAAFIF